MNYNGFRRLRGLPWSLGRVNISENIRNLRQDSEPSYPVSSKIWTLARLGYNETQLEEGISLLISVPWNTLAMEQDQDFAVKINKRHDEYKSSTLTARTVVASMQPLVSKSAEE